MFEVSQTWKRSQFVNFLKLPPLSMDNKHHRLRSSFSQSDLTMDAVQLGLLGWRSYLETGKYRPNEAVIPQIW